VLLGGIGFVLALIYLKQSLANTPLRVKSKQKRVSVAERKSVRFGIQYRQQFLAYVGIGIFDEAARSGIIVFLSFLLLDKGVPKVWLGSLLALLLVGGALGKFLCGYLNDRLGAIYTIILTEVLMIAGWVLLPAMPWHWLLLPMFLLGFGFVVNGTSSVMYIGLADTLAAQRQSVGYSIYYTISFASAAFSPLGFGVLADHYGVPTVYSGIAVMTLLIFPLLYCLRKGREHSRRERKGV
jgi:MFS family permease